MNGLNECIDGLNRGCMYPTNEGGSRGVRGGAEKGRLFFVYMRGNWLGTKNDCIAVLFVCVGFLFGKLIFLIIPDSILFFFPPISFFCFSW